MMSLSRLLIFYIQPHSYLVTCLASQLENWQVHWVCLLLNQVRHFKLSGWKPLQQSWDSNNLRFWLASRSKPRLKWASDLWCRLHLYLSQDARTKPRSPRRQTTATCQGTRSYGTPARILSFLPSCNKQPWNEPGIQSSIANWQRLADFRLIPSHQTNICAPTKVNSKFYWRRHNVSCYCLWSN